jgi:hypothetical protein
MIDIKNIKPLRLMYLFIGQIINPFRFVSGIRGFFWFFRDFFSYRKQELLGNRMKLDFEPALHERNSTHEFDAHYFYVNSWAFRRVISSSPEHHVDIASQVIFSSLLSAVLPVTYIDFRTLAIELSGFSSKQGSILNLPYPDNSLYSVSCLHVAEHIGLGRYGDSLDSEGTIKACAELTRVLAHGGNLFFAVPIGKPRVCFNAHRIHSVQMILSYFEGVSLHELSGVDDRGNFHSNISFEKLNSCDYGLGLFWLKKGLET